MSARNGSNGHGFIASSSNGESSNHSHLPEPSHSKAGSGGSTSSANGHTNGHTFVMAPEEQIGFRSLYEGSRLDRTEFIRITLQSLKELGYDASAKSLESESGIILEHTSIIAFRKAVISGDWKNAERLLMDGLNNGARRLLGSSRLNTTPSDIDSVLREPQIRGVDSIKFLLHQQRYLELLEARQTRKALSVLRDRLAPLNHGSDRLHQLSSLVICANPEELRSRAKWEGTGLASREKLLREVESAVSPLVMVPSRRLPHLLEQAQQLQKMLDPFFNLPPDAQMSLYIDHQSDRSVFPTQIAATLSAHTDEVWHVAFSHDGTRLASVGVDREALIWSVGSSQDEFEVLHRLGPHTGPICHAAWSPDDTMLLTTTQDGEVNVWQVKSGEKTTYNEHIYTVGTAAWLPDGQQFITGSMDGRIILWNLDGTKRHTWSTTPYRVQALAVSPNGKHLVAISIRSVPATGGSGNSGNVASNIQGGISARDISYTSEAHLRHIQRAAVRRTDMEMIRDDNNGDDDVRSFDEMEDLGGGSRFEGDEKQRIHFYNLENQEQIGSIYLKDELTSVVFSDDSKEILVNQRPNEAQIWNVERQCLVMRLNGHKVQRHVIRSCFGGVERSFVISGSEDSCIYVYHRKTGKLLEKLKGHGVGSVNSVDWHPTLHNCFVSCSDDGTIRLWKPKLNRSGYSTSSQYDEYHFNKVGGHIHNGHDSDLHMEEPSPFPWSNSSPRMPGSPPPRLATLGTLEAAITRSSTESRAVAAAAVPLSSPRDDNEEDEEEEEEEEEDDEEDDAEIMAE